MEVMKKKVKILQEKAKGLSIYKKKLLSKTNSLIFKYKLIQILFEDSGQGLFNIF